MTQLPPAPRDPHDDGGGDEWHALLRGENPRGENPRGQNPRGENPRGETSRESGAHAPAPATPAPAPAPAHDAAPAPATPSGEPPASDRPLTRRELREVEQRQFAEEEAIRLIVAADVDAPRVPAGASAATSAARTGSASHPASSAESAEPAERIRTARTELDDIVGLEPDTPHGPRPSRAERRAAARHPHDAAGPPRRRRGGWGCLIGLVVVLALAIGAFFVLQGPITAIIDRFTPAADYSGQGTGEVLFQVEEGDSGTSIGSRLYEQDVVASEAAFLEAIDDAPTAVTFYPGVFRLAEQMSAQAALAGLTDDANRLENTVLIREGMWADDVLAEISAVLQIPDEELQAVAANPQALGLPAEATSLEGFLFPDTYTFDPGVTAQQVVQQMVDLSLQSFDAAGVPAEDRYRVATIASLIEREGLPQDFGKVSRVVQNRLDESMPLQFDSTVHYGIADHSEVTTSDAERADAGNLYNTYVHPGLPPGPIGNPGAEAIRAALAPEEGPWLYFVTVNPDTGETVFSVTYAEHEAAAQRFYQWLEDQPADG